MASETMSTLDAVLKIDYLPVLQNQFNKELVLYNRIKRDKHNVSGKEYRFPVHNAWSESVGAIAEEGVVPVAAAEGVANSFGPVRTVAGRFEVSTKVIHATKSDRTAFVQAVDWKMKGLGDNMRKELNFMLQSDGSGALAKVSSVSGQDITVDNPNNIRKNQILNAFSARTGGSQRNGDFTVSNVNYDTKVVTVVGTISAIVANDFLFRNTGRGINVMGLLGIVDDATFVGTLQGIARAGNAYWNASVIANSGTGRDLTQGLLQLAEDKAYQKSGSQLSAFYSGLGQRQNYVQLVTADRRYVNSMDFDAGYKALEYNGRPWFVDRDAERGVIFGLDEEAMRFFMLADIDWMDDDGAVLARGANLTYVATLEGHMELGTYQPNRHVVIRDLNEPTSY